MPDILKPVYVMVTTSGIVLKVVNQNIFLARILCSLVQRSIYFDTSTASNRRYTDVDEHVPWKYSR